MNNNENTLILHLGSNIENRHDNLKAAIIAIEKEVGSIHQQSHIYETEAWGVENQADFLNIAIEVSTSLSPNNVLSAIHLIENQLGRIRTQKWGARTIDIDILFYNQLILETELLTIPHIQIPKRNFVLIPLLDIIPEFVHPILEISMEVLYWNSKDQQEVRRWEMN